MQAWPPSRSGFTFLWRIIGSTYASGDGPALVHVDHLEYLVNVKLGELIRLLPLDPDPAHSLELGHYFHKPKKKILIVIMLVFHTPDIVQCLHPPQLVLVQQVLYLKWFEKNIIHVNTKRFHLQRFQMFVHCTEIKDNLLQIYFSVLLLVYFSE